MLSALTLLFYCSCYGGEQAEPESTPAEDASVTVDRLNALLGSDVSVSEIGGGSIQVKIGFRCEEILGRLAQEPDRVRRKVETLILDDVTVSVAAIRACRKFPQLKVLMVEGKGWNADCANEAGKIESLTTLWVQNLGVQGHELAAICKAKKLRSLMLGGNPIDSGRFEPLGGLDQLIQLDLSGTGVKDADLEFLGGCPELLELHLDDTSLSDEAVGHIAACKKLRFLSLTRTKLTKRGADRLKKELPDVAFSWTSAGGEMLEVGTLK